MRLLVSGLVLVAASTCALAQDAANPVVSSAKEIFVRQSGYMIAAAEQMPADEYGYHPTPDQWTYGKIVSHVIQANFGVCGMLSGEGPGQAPPVTDTMPKDQLIPVLKQSFDTCQKALDGLQGLEPGRNHHLFPRSKETARARPHRAYR